MLDEISLKGYGGPCLMDVEALLTFDTADRKRNAS
jgi:hypothetical protein